MQIHDLMSFRLFFHKTPHLDLELHFLHPISPCLSGSISMGLAMDHGHGQPTPREPKSASKLAQLQAQNRRREFLHRHPSYFKSAEHELADPVLYERLVKRHQSVSEREAEKRTKGYGRTLEADLVRGEAKLASIAPPGSRDINEESGPSSIGRASGLENEWDQPIDNKDRGIELWHAFLTERFIQGQDDDFDYAAVDSNEDYDTMTRKDAEDAWFDEEEPSWVDDEGEAKERPKQGETGVQDY
ncbi:hypothetical protein HJFPF1_05258 [Paramyrothecium foliicola]|nr:hypothetical protein HJFPF1_05258 [Paramyrothecium foliicola]